MRDRRQLLLEHRASVRDHRRLQRRAFAARQHARETQRHLPQRRIAGDHASERHRLP
jgi:hypothetical protein